MSDGGYYEYRAEFWDDRPGGIGRWTPLCYDMESQGWANEDLAKDDFAQAVSDGFKTRLVRRHIGPVEVIEGE